jgi:hypothetical protein
MFCTSGKKEGHRRAATQPEQPERAYLILTLERTGSGLLCDTLERTGRLGTPYELFGAPYIHGRSTEFGIAAVDSTPESPRPTSFSILLARGTGVWGLVDGDEAPQMTNPEPILGQRTESLLRLWR